MKKLVLVLLAGLLLTPSEMFTDKYNSKRVFPFSSPFRSPAQYPIGLYLDEETGDIAITPNYDIRITGVGSNDHLPTSELLQMKRQSVLKVAEYSPS